ncbi:Trafficking protein particle complex subunit [Thalictrum thalictroides]|uniref:Trafficking protein particle complex subunit n=1 Tax=Thalictrum thalictroides TaxID=46969 RepID=A0A7J6X7Q9_THATH|nr:Trafficking protein particle complex subunit [Thalictrum thalictroides]
MGRVVARGRNAKTVVVVVQSTESDEVSEDRIIALRKRAEVDSKYLLNFVSDASQLKESLNRLGSTFAELANTYYREEGKRIKARMEKKNTNSLELIIRYCFKVAVYAEFRRDWVEALKFYEEAYHTLREMIGVSTRLPPIQRLIEIKTVAEQLCFKVSTLLLHGGKVIEAMTWFRKHIACYRKLVGAPDVVFLHWEWVSRQFLVFAELLETSSVTVPNTSSQLSVMLEKGLTEWEFNPAHYYQLAAHYLREKRLCLEVALSVSEASPSSAADGIESSSVSVIPSVFIGQFSQLFEQEDAFRTQPLTDAEYILYAIAEGKRFQDSFEIIALLKKSFEMYNSLKAQRMASYCGHLMAIEYFTIGDFSNAKQLFDGVASLYRKEGWVALLWEVLGYLRECSKRLSSVKDFAEYSLQMAALPIASSSGFQTIDYKRKYGPAGPASLSQRQSIHNEVFELLRGEYTLSSNEGSGDLKVDADRPVHLEIDPISPLRVVLLASVAFHEQVVKPGVSSSLTLSLLSQLPHPVEINHLEIHFNQPERNFIITSAQRPSGDQQDLRVETAPFLMLHTNKWLRLTYDMKSELSGKLECVSVIAKLGPYFTIICRAESPASMDDLPLWKFEDHVETLPTKDPGLAFSGQKVIQIEEQDPQIDLVLGATGPALVGESFLVPVTVTSKGHSVYFGELKINLVDARGGGLVSPRETEPFSNDSHHVQLLNILGPDGENESPSGPDNIRSIQHSFGLVSVPLLNFGESWSCNLEIKWQKPKPIMLYVSLGYLPSNHEAKEQKVHVHKSLQIEGKTALGISHHFMFPFRRDPLLLRKVKPIPGSDQTTSLAFKETSILVVSARNCTEVPLHLMSISIDVDDDDTGRSCRVQQGSGSLPSQPLLVPGEEFKQVFSVIPEVCLQTVSVGTVCLRWRRESFLEEQICSSITAAGAVTRHKLPDVNVELVPLVLSLECPPYAILGEPFTCYVRIQNKTKLLQEIKYSLADSQSFVLSGSHNDTIFVMPKSEHILGFKLVPLASGSQQLPRVTVTSVRYSTGFQPSLAAATIFIFPSKPHFEMEDKVIEKKASLLVNEQIS